MKKLSTFLASAVIFTIALSIPFLGLKALNKGDIEEVAGKDISYIPPIKGSIRYDYKYEDYGVFEFTSKYDDGDNPVTKAVEGKHSQIQYYLFSSKSKLEVMRNYENALKSAGWKIIIPVDPQKLHLTQVVAQKVGPGQEIWAQINVSDNEGKDESGNNVIWYQIDVVEKQAMKQEVMIDEAYLKKQLDESGRVAVYGINFDTGKSTIKPDSEKVLSQIGGLLNNNKDLKLSIEGHTDNVGSKDANQKLSEQRAASVKDYLVKNYKIDGSRLTTKGFGDSKPIADNSSEDGKAKNRRVELVKI